jgi:hypothetical protein
MAQYLGSDSEPSGTGFTYPYLVVRHTEHSFRKYPIWFMRKSEKEFVQPGDKKLVIGIPDDVDESVGMDVSRDLIIDSARMHMSEQPHQVCVVFGEDDCVYLGHDGSVMESSSPPSREEPFGF